MYLQAPADWAVGLGWLKILFEPRFILYTGTGDKITIKSLKHYLAAIGINVLYCILKLNKYYDIKDHHFRDNRY